MNGGTDPFWQAQDMDSENFRGARLIPKTEIEIEPRITNYPENRKRKHFWQPARTHARAELELRQTPLPPLRESAQDRHQVWPGPAEAQCPCKIGGLGMIEVKKYRQTRFWAVYVDGELLAVVVYRKGAQAIADHLIQIARGKGTEHAA